MANEIKALLGNNTALTITIASLNTVLVGSVQGQQSSTVSNTSDLFQKIHIYAQVTTGTSPTADKSIKMYQMTSDGAGYYTDGGGGKDSVLTVVNANLIAAVATDATSDKAYTLEATINNPGAEWGVVVVQDTGKALNTTGGNHFVRYTGENPEVQ